MDDLDRLSLKELRDLRIKVDRMIASYEERRRREAIAAVEEAAREHGFSLNELTGVKLARSSSRSAPRYVNPDDPSMTWTGRGRRPRWVNDAINAGKDLEDLHV